MMVESGCAYARRGTTFAFATFCGRGPCPDDTLLCREYYAPAHFRVPCDPGVRPQLLPAQFLCLMRQSGVFLGASPHAKIPSERKLQDTCKGWTTGDRPVIVGCDNAAGRAKASAPRLRRRS